MDSIVKSGPANAIGKPRCPVCRSRHVVTLCDVDGYHVWRCPASATDFVWPAPDDEELKRYYDRAGWFEGGERGGYASYDAQTAGSLPMIAEVLDAFADRQAGQYVLDVGCGYGNHLAIAADRGWKCFGVEVSDHARGIASERHSDRMTLVPTIEELVPHEFDLVLMLDMIEHVADPYALFFRLFNRGLIGPKTRLVITTPNARSIDAVEGAGQWQYRHPPSHLVYYSARSLRRLLSNLQFADIQVRGTSPLARKGRRGYEDETLSSNESLQDDAGLLCVANGSRFFGFMQERYVPGTWSKLAEYEHLPRYQFARRFAVDKIVLDFGCGTGYGSRLLADVAQSVVGLDIDRAAIDWATLWHDPARLAFDCRNDLGAGFQSGSFDLVTCFEMIEHVDHATQLETIRNIARLLKADGQLVISTPNPAVTANYGENPYHLREMDEVSFRQLLAPVFAHVSIKRQWIRPSVAIGSIDVGVLNSMVVDFLPAARLYGEPAAYVAICSQAPVDAVDTFLTLDSSADFLLVELRRQQAETALRLERYAMQERSMNAVAQASQQLAEREKLLESIIDKNRGLDEQARQLVEAELQRMASENRQRAEHAKILALLEEKNRGLDAQARQLVEMESNRVEKERLFALQAGDIAGLKDEIAEAHLQLKDEIAKALRLAQDHDTETAVLRGQIASLQERIKELTPWWFKVARRLRRQPVNLDAGSVSTIGIAPPESTAIATAVRPTFAAYTVKQPTLVETHRPRVLHAIANFMTGGSSRLVVDLIERLGGDFEQRIVTSFVPKPPEYLGVDITELPIGTSRDRIAQVVAAFEPALVHIHYWGDCDEPWYREVFAAVARQEIPIVQNVNTPVAPFVDTRSDHVVFVSSYVRETFGSGVESGEVIYPGSDFEHFERRSDLLDNRCVGMVYRLEADKLNASAIDVFIRIAQALPDVVCLIVGGGSLLEPFKASVRAAGCEASFEFTGYVSYEALPALYARMGLFVAPVWKESFGQVSSFAMNMGIPVIGYDVGAIAEIVANPSLVAAAGDAEALADIAIRVLRDRPLRRAVMEANQARASGLFSVEAMVDRYRTVYKRFARPAA